MSWENILEAVCAAPSLVLKEITRSWSNFWSQEEKLMREGEYVEEPMDAD